MRSAINSKAVDILRREGQFELYSYVRYTQTYVYCCIILWCIFHFKSARTKNTAVMGLFRYNNKNGPSRTAGPLLINRFMTTEYIAIVRVGDGRDENWCIVYIRVYKVYMYV